MLIFRLKEVYPNINFHTGGQLANDKSEEHKMTSRIFSQQNYNDVNFGKQINLFTTCSALK